MFEKNDKRFSKNSVLFKLSMALVALLFIGVGVLMFLLFNSGAIGPNDGKPQTMTGIIVLAGCSVTGVVVFLVALALNGMRTATAMDIKLIRNKLYGNDNSTIEKVIGEKAAAYADVTAIDTYLTAINDSIRATNRKSASPATPAAPAHAEETDAPAPKKASVTKTAPVSKNKIASRTAAPGKKIPPRVDTTGVDPDELATLNDLFESGAVSAEQYKALVERKKNKK